MSWRRGFGGGLVGVAGDSWAMVWEEMDCESASFLRDAGEGEVWRVTLRGLALSAAGSLYAVGGLWGLRD